MTTPIKDKNDQAVQQKVGQTTTITTKTRSFSTELVIGDKRGRSTWCGKNIVFAFIVDFLVVQDNNNMIQFTMVVRPLYCRLTNKEVATGKLESICKNKVM